MYGVVGPHPVRFVQGCHRAIVLDCNASQSIGFSHMVYVYKCVSIFVLGRRCRQRRSFIGQPPLELAQRIGIASVLRREHVFALLCAQSGKLLVS